jgi:TRAP-type C4-dicarboxylate transport system substrate-binding protein
VVLIFLAIPFFSECVAQPQKRMVLSHGTFLPESGVHHIAVKEFFKGLEDATGGAVKTEFHWSGSLGGAKDLYGMTVDRLADTSTVNPQYTQGVFPMFSIFELPIQFPSGQVLTTAALRMYKKGYFDKEFANVKVIALYTLSPYILQCRERKLTTVEDFKGLKVRAGSAITAQMFKLFGAAPVQTTTAEMYSNLQKGVTDVDFSPFEAVIIFKTYEVIKYVNEWRTITSGFIIAMNKEVWNALPKGGQEYIEKNWENYSLKYAAAYDAAHGRAKELLLKTPGREIINFAPGEKEKMDKLLASIWNNWITDKEAKGLPGKMAVSDLYKTLTDLGVEKPFVGYTPR